MMAFSAPGLYVTSNTCTLAFSSSTFRMAVALAIFSCAIAEFTTAPANRNAGTSSPARTAADLFMISPFFPPEWRREPFYAPAASSNSKRWTKKHPAGERCFELPGVELSWLPDQGKSGHWQVLLNLL